MSVLEKYGIGIDEFDDVFTPPKQQQPSPSSGYLKYPEIDRYASEAAKKYNLDENLYKAMLYEESMGGKPDASPGTSSAYGPSQLIESTARELGVNRMDPYQNVMGGAQYLRQQLDSFGEDPRVALAAYFRGPGYAKNFSWDDPSTLGGATVRGHVDRIMKRKAEFDAKTNQFWDSFEFDDDIINSVTSKYAPDTSAAQQEPTASPLDVDIPDIKPETAIAETTQAPTAMQDEGKPGIFARLKEQGQMVSEERNRLFKTGEILRKRYDRLVNEKGISPEEKERRKGMFEKIELDTDYKKTAYGYYLSEKELRPVRTVVDIGTSVVAGQAVAGTLTQLPKLQKAFAAIEKINSPILKAAASKALNGIVRAATSTTVQGAKTLPQEQILGTETIAESLMNLGETAIAAAVSPFFEGIATQIGATGLEPIVQGLSGAATNFLMDKARGREYADEDLIKIAGLEIPKRYVTEAFMDAVYGLNDIKPKAEFEVKVSGDTGGKAVAEPNIANSEAEMLLGEQKKRAREAQPPRVDSRGERIGNIEDGMLSGDIVRQVKEAYGDTPPTKNQVVNDFGVSREQARVLIDNAYPELVETAMGGADVKPAAKKQKSEKVETKAPDAAIQNGEAIAAEIGGDVRFDGIQEGIQTAKVSIDPTLTFTAKINGEEHTVNVPITATASDVKAKIAEITGDTQADVPSMQTASIDRGFGYDIRTGKYGIDPETLDMQLDGIESKISKGSFDPIQLRGTELDKFPTSSLMELRKAFESNPQEALENLRRLLTQADVPSAQTVTEPSQSGADPAIKTEPKPTPKPSFPTTKRPKNPGTTGILSDDYLVGLQVKWSDKYKALPEAEKFKALQAERKSLSDRIKSAEDKESYDVWEMEETYRVLGREMRKYSKAAETKTRREETQLDRYSESGKPDTNLTKQVHEDINSLMEVYEVRDTDLEAYFEYRYTPNQIAAAVEAIRKGNKDGKAAAEIRKEIGGYLATGTRPAQVKELIDEKVEINAEKSGMESAEGDTGIDTDFDFGANVKSEEPKMSDQTGDLFGRSEGEQRIAEELQNRKEKAAARQKENIGEDLPLFDKNEREAAVTKQESLIGAIEETAKSVDEFVEQELLAAQQGSITLPGGNKKQSAQKESSIPEGVNQEALNRRREARGASRDGFVKRLSKLAERLYKSSTRHHAELDPVKDAAVNEIVRQYESSPVKVDVVSGQVLRGITAGLKGDEIELFEANVILPDLIRAVERNPDAYAGQTELWYGYKNVEEIKQDYEKYRSAAEDNPIVSAAINRRKKFVSVLTKELVSKKLLPKQVLENPDYYHRMILDYMELKDASTKTGIATPGKRGKKSYQKRRAEGATKDFNTKYAEAEREWVKDAMQQLEDIKFVERIDAESGIGKKVEGEYKAALEMLYIDMGGNLEDIKAFGSSYVYGLKNAITAIDEKALAKAGLKDNKKFIPEGYTEVPIEKMKVYRAKTIPEAMIDEVMDGVTEFSPEILKEVMVLGGKGKTIIVPENVGSLMQNLIKPRSNNPIAQASRRLMGSWKWAKLNAPTRAVKYQLNNWFGDADAAFAAYPGIFTEYKNAIKDLWNINSGKGIDSEIIDAIGKGVIGSGYASQEVPDISRSDFFGAMLGRKKTIGKLLSSPVKAYSDFVSTINGIREDSLRLAAYRYVRKMIESGKNPYGASNRRAVEALRNSKTMSIDDRAAKVSRELLGDYGARTETGQFIREHVVPFWSWIEINLPRYYRMFTNAPFEGNKGGKGRVAAAAVAKGALLAGKRTIQASAFLMAVDLWNRFGADRLYPGVYDEMDEDTRQNRIILHRDSEGNIITLRAQGAFSDVLSWADLESPTNKVEDFITGEKGIKDLGKDAVNALVNNAVGAIGPQYKWVGEVVSKKQLYPDILNPRNIRDRGEYIAKQFEVDPVYRWLAKIPSRGLQDEVMNAVVYKQSAGEGAYFKSLRLIDGYIEKMGGTVNKAGYTPSERSNALYYYKKAVRYKDRAAAKKWKEEYERLGGRMTDINKSARGQNPFAKIPERHRAGFLQSLSEKDRKVFESAASWYSTIYEGVGKGIEYATGTGE